MSASESTTEGKESASAQATTHVPVGPEVNAMFSGIAGRYDFANHFLSGGVDYYWRRVLVKMVKARSPRDVFDLATGSGDVAFALKRAMGDSAKVTGLDFCQPMLDEAIKKRDQQTGPLLEIEFAQGDCLKLPLADESADVLTISFGLRNLEDRQAGLREMRRVLRPGGTLFCLEFTQPDRWFRPFYYLYLKTVLPLMAGVVTGKKDAYQYLAGTISSFPTKAQLADQMREAGFRTVEARGLTFSIVAIHSATK